MSPSSTITLQFRGEFEDDTLLMRLGSLSRRSHYYYSYSSPACDSLELETKSKVSLAAWRLRPTRNKEKVLLLHPPYCLAGMPQTRTFRGPY